jgi:F0F1-type ATP synthase membrane subunit b/b'
MLFNQTLNSFSGHVADLPISLNTDIFEANLVNLVLLTGGIFYLGSNALSESLAERQQKILGAIQESEERLQQAVVRLDESETQLKQAQIGTIEAKVRKQISDYVVTLALQRVTLQLEGNIGSNLQQQIIDTNISKLGS